MIINANTWEKLVEFTNRHPVPAFAGAYEAESGCPLTCFGECTGCRGNCEGDCMDTCIARCESGAGGW